MEKGDGIEGSFVNSTIVVGVLAGGFILLLMYIIRLVKADPKKNERSLAGKATPRRQQQEREQQQQNQQKQQQHQQKNKELQVHGKSKKKAADSRWSGRTDKQTYTHPWLLTSLKGHTGQVLDMDFSSNGKYLASCAEEEPDPGGDPGSSSDCNKENSQPSSTNPSPRSKSSTTTGLSRRQRKNRRRDDSSPPENKKKPKPKRPEQLAATPGGATGTGNGNVNGNGNGNKKSSLAQHHPNYQHHNNQHHHHHIPLKQFTKLNISERDLASFLRAYLLSPEQMLTLGYPVESSLHPGKAIIFKSPINVPSYTTSDYRQHPKTIDVNKSRFDVNAREFIPGRGMNYAQIKAEWKANHDSGQGSGSSSDSGESGEILDDGEDGSDVSHSSSDSGGSFSLGSSPPTAACEEEQLKSANGDGGGSSSSSRSSPEPPILQCAEERQSKGVDSCNSDSRAKGQTTGGGGGNGSNSSGSSNVTLSANKFVNKIKDIDLRGGPGEERKCVRCGKGFLVGSDNEYLTQERCLYHWGKLRNVVHPAGKYSKDNATEYACCKGKSDSRGCTTGKFHVWNGLAVGFNGPFDLYTRTRPRKTPPTDGNYGVYALDCEMCYTVQGLELTKITVIGVDGRLVYDCFVRPECEIVDYNTRFSGITAKDLSKKSSTKTLKEVQNDLMGFVNADTILIGHGLENDLRALRIMHSTVIDTAVTFPHYNGLPYRRSLKSLTSCFLKRDIQQSSHGHNSYEDARACMELMLWRVRKDFRSILDHYHRQ